MKTNINGKTSLVIAVSALTTGAVIYVISKAAGKVTKRETKKELKDEEKSNKKIVDLEEKKKETEEK